MGDFKDWIEKQKKEDRRIFRHAVSKVQSAVDASIKSSSFVSEGNDGESAEGRELAWQLLDYFKISRIEIPAEILPEMQMDYILDAVHIMRRPVLLADDWWQHDLSPLLCKAKETGKLHLLLPGSHGGYVWIEPHSGQQQRVTAASAKIFEMDAYCFYPPFSKESYNAVGFVAALLKSYTTWDWVMLILMSIAAAGMGLVVPMVNQFIFDRVIPSGVNEGVAPIMALLFGVVFTTALFQFLRRIWIVRTSSRGKYYIESGIWNRMLRLPVGFYKNYESGDLTERVFLLEELCEALQESIIPTLLTLVFSIVYLFQIRFLSGSLALPSCLILGFVLVIAAVQALIQMKVNQQINETNAAISGFLYQVYVGIRKIRLCGAEVRVFSKWAKLYQQKAKLQFHQQQPVRYAQAFLRLIILGGTLLVYLIVFKHQLSATTYIAYQIAFGNLLAAVLQMGQVTEQLAFIHPAFQMIEPLISEKEENSGRKPAVLNLAGKIELSNISFRYQPQMDYVLHNLNLTVSEGEYVAVTGPSGCGKSTLFRILLGFEKAETGAVYYDDKDMALLDVRSIRKRIGTVLQDGKLIDSDIFSNIALCVPQLTMEQAWEAARQAGLAEDIEDMPMGMYTMVSESGGSISGGQRQRILIARVLAMKPNILLFDEATSALDNHTQAAVIHTLEQMKGTRIVIAHRLSTIRKCDRILYLSGGRVAESGTYEELMALDGDFAKMARRQLT